MPDNKFLPYETVTRAQFGTALSRLLFGIEVWHRLSDGITAKTRIEHHSALKDVTVEGSCRAELTEKAIQEGEKVRYGQ